MPFSTKAIRDRARQRIARRVRGGEGCCFCGRAIDLTVPYPHPESFVVDHQIPTSRGGRDFGEEQLRPAHNSCNRARSDHPDGSIGANSGALGLTTGWGGPP